MNPSKNHQVRKVFLNLFFLLLSFWFPFQVYGQEFTSVQITLDSGEVMNIQNIVNVYENNPVFDSLPKILKPEHEDLPDSLPIPEDEKVSPQELPNLIVPFDSIKRQSPKTNLLFPGLGDNNTSIPPDLGGAVGRNHLMIALNTQVAFQDKVGTLLMPPISLNTFWQTTGTFDPKVLYDPYYDRWIVTACANSFSPNSSLLIAVSTTDDPTGAWVKYSIDVDNTNQDWFDYPSIGFSNDKIVVSGNMFSIAGGMFSGTQTYVFLKTELYAGIPLPTVGRISGGMGGTLVPAITYDDNLSDMYLLQRWNGNAGGAGYLRQYILTGAIPPYTLTASGFVSIGQTWSSGNPGAPQLGSVNTIANNDDRLQNVVYRNGSLWTTHGVGLPASVPTRTAVQWWEINPTNRSVIQFGRIDDNTNTTFYAFPSIAVNSCNDAFLGFSCFSGNKYASAAYAFRAGTDPLNTFNTPVISKQGLASYFKTFSGTTNRWGDYSSTTVDPDDLSLWTLQQYAEQPVGGSSRWGTEWTSLPPACPDLYMKDTPADIGMEPNQATGAYWVSEDIWIRNNQDGLTTHQNPEYRIGTNNPNYVYVRVRNRGGSASSGTEELNLYWAKAGINLSWPAPWNGGVYHDPGPNTMLLGEELIDSPQLIGSIPAGGSAVLVFEWSPPDPQLYAAAFGLDKSHFCILARITSSTPPPYGMAYLETTDLYSNVKNNNNIIWKNVTVVDLLPGVQKPEFVSIGNFQKEQQLVRIQFGEKEIRELDFLQYGIVTVSVDDKLMGKLIEGGDLKGFEILNENRLELIEPGASFENVLLEEGEQHLIGIHLEWKKRARPNRKQLYRFDILAFNSQDKDDIDQPLGGETFTIERKRKRCWLWPWLFKKD